MIIQQTPRIMEINKHVKVIINIQKSYKWPNPLIKNGHIISVCIQIMSSHLCKVIQKCHFIYYIHHKAWTVYLLPQME